MCVCERKKTNKKRGREKKTEQKREREREHARKSERPTPRDQSQRPKPRDQRASEGEKLCVCVSRYSLGATKRHD